MSESLKQMLVDLGDAAKAEGVNFVGVLATYDAKSAHFSTRISLAALPCFGVTEDHILLDINREIAVEWSNGCHEGKLTWDKVA